MKVRISPIVYQLYLFQLENYELPRYFSLLKRKGIFPPPKLRGKIKWTGKARLLLAIAIVIHALLTAAAAALAYEYYFDFWVTTLTFLFFAVFFLFFYFLFFAAASSILAPFQAVLAMRIINRARARLESFPEVKVIGIAGSYGKTGMKQALKSVLSEKFKVAATPESVNTPLGIARYANSHVDESTQAFIVEMGEHYQGDVSELCDITSPDIGIIAGINESHQERLGHLSRAVETVFELAAGLKKGGLLVANADDANVKVNYRKSAPGLEPKFYSSYGDDLCGYQVKDYRFDPETLINSFSIWENGAKLADFKTRILGEYCKGVAVAALIVGRRLGMSPQEVARGFAELKPTPHRLEPVPNSNGLVIIDDSYNGNPDGVREAISLLSKFEGKRKVYLTPGLVEMGASTQKVHERIGRQLAKVADLVLLVKNSVTPHIEEGLKSAGFADERIIKYADVDEAHGSLDKILKPGDVVMFQNDWGDQYL